MGCGTFILILFIIFFLTKTLGVVGFFIAVIISFFIISSQKGGKSIETSDIKLICPLCGQAELTSDNNGCCCPACKERFRYNKMQLLFYKTLYSILAKMAKADGKISQKEADVINDFLENILQLDSAEKKIAKVIFKNAKTDGLTIYDHASLFAQFNQPDMAEILYQLLWKIAGADGKFDAREDEFLRNLPSYLNLPSYVYKQYKSRFSGTQQQTMYAPNLQECYELLGCSPDDTDSDIKKKYKKKIAEFHPDRIQAKGLPPEFIKFANEQMQKINTAYETIMKARKNKVA